jgi:hypothetical protein
MPDLEDLTPEQIAALRSFATRNGRGWKKVLSDLWMRAAAAPTLHNLRNTHGPTWLVTFQFPTDDFPPRPKP